VVTRAPPKKHDTDFPEKCTRIPGFGGTARDNPKTMSDAKNKKTKGERTKGDTHKTKGENKRAHPQKGTRKTKGTPTKRGTKGDTHTWGHKKVDKRGHPHMGAHEHTRKEHAELGALRLLDGGLSPTAASICLVAWALLAHSDHRQNACRDFSNREWHKVGRHSCLCCFSRSINNG